MKKKLFILDTDPDYAEHLSDCLNRQKNFPFETEGFTDTDAFLHCIESGAVDAVLISDARMELQDIKRWMEDRDDSVRVVRLTDGEEEDGICRYQSGDDLKRQICERLKERKGSPSKEEVIGVYSPVHRCGSTVFAVILASVLAEQRQTIYVNLEDYHGFDAFASIDCKNDLSDLVYCSRLKGERNLSVVLKKAVVKWEELDVLCPAPVSGDLWDIGHEEWETLFGMIISTGEYESMILDIGSHIKEIYPLLSLCGRIYMPVLNDRISQGKIRQFEDNLADSGEEAILGKLKKIVVPKLRSDNELSGFPRQLVRGKIGSYVRQLAIEEGLI